MTEHAGDIASIQSISSIPTILEAVAALTGMRFVCIARVTGDSWTTWALLDKLDFALKVGDGLDVATTCAQKYATRAMPSSSTTSASTRSSRTMTRRACTDSAALFQFPCCGPTVLISAHCARSIPRLPTCPARLL